MPSEKKHHLHMPLPAVLMTVLHLLMGVLLVAAGVVGWLEVNGEAFVARILSREQDVLRGAMPSVLVFFVLTVFYWLLTIPWVVLLVRRSPFFPRVYTVVASIECCIPGLYFTLGSLAVMGKRMNDMWLVLFFTVCGCVFILLVFSIIYTRNSLKLREFLAIKKQAS